MAITNAQQYKQLLAKGGRIGFKGGADASTIGFSKSYDKANPAGTKRAANKASDLTVGAGGASFQDDATPGNLNVPGRDERIEIKRKNYEDEVKKFIEKKKPTDTKGGLLTQGINLLNKAGNKFNPKARQYMLDQSGKGKQFFDAYFNNLEDASSVYDLDAEELADLNKAYYQARSLGQIDAAGNPIGGSIESDGTYIPRDGGGDNYIPPIIPEGGEGGDADDVNADDQGIINYRLMADGGMTNDAPVYEGGIMDLESGRQQYFLGKLVKKVTRGVKKIVKSPIGKAALTAALFKFGGGFGKGPGSAFVKLFGANNTMPGFENVSTAKMGGILEKLGLTKGFGSYMPTALGGIAASTIGSYFMTPEEKDDEEELYAGADIDDPKKIMANAAAGKFDYLNYRNAANGGLMRNNYAEGSEEPVAKKTMPLSDMDGQEMDLREEGGFVPLGRMERADDVPARLSKNEFVFTADAVRNAGEGDVDKGAEVMYNMMKNLESGGEVSEESQGLEGAREMFQTSQRLEEVI